MANSNWIPMRMYNYMEDDMNSMMDVMTHDLVTDRLAPCIGPAVQHHNIIAQSRTCNYEYDLLNSWVTKSRWTSLVNQYVNQASLELFLGQVEAKLDRPKASGVAFLRSQTVKARNEHTGGRVARRWGSCMIGWSFRRAPQAQITMHSRSTYFGFVAPLDVGVAHKIAGLVAERTGLTLDEIGFTWHLEQGSYHAFRSMPWWWTTPERTELLKHVLESSRKPDTTEFYPVSKLIGTTLKRYQKDDRQGTLYGDMAYAQHRRFRMMWHLMTKDPEHYQRFLGQGMHATVNTMPRLKSVPLSTLELKSKHLAYNDDTEGDYEDDAFSEDVDIPNYPKPEDD